MVAEAYNGRMRARRMIWRIVRGLVLGACCGYVALLAVVQVGQRVVRHRAERMMGDIAALEVGKSKFSDLQTIQHRWGRWGHYDGECSARHCQYSVRMEDWFGQVVSWGSQFFPQHENDLMSVAMRVTHGHLPAVLADVAVKDGLVSSFSAAVWVAVPTGHSVAVNKRVGGAASDEDSWPGPYTLMASYMSGWSAPTYPTDWPEPDPPARGHTIWKPTGCENCLAIHIQPMDGQSVRSLGHVAEINFDCITQWSFCRVEENIAPNAWKEYLQDLTVSQEHWRRLAGCDYPFSQRFAAAGNVVLVRLVEGISGSEQSLPTVRLIRSLKGVSLKEWDNFKVSTEYGENQLQASKAGREFVLMFPADGLSHEGKHLGVEVYSCGIVETSEETLQNMLAGGS
jgi:hypothetical protein